MLYLDYADVDVNTQDVTNVFLYGDKRLKSMFINYSKLNLDQVMNNSTIIESVISAIIKELRFIEWQIIYNLVSKIIVKASNKDNLKTLHTLFTHKEFKHKHQAIIQDLSTPKNSKDRTIYDLLQQEYDKKHPDSEIQEILKNSMIALS